jgi:(1->4)-alpha-D-glucan 1-alpha-D-glucosylmutase
VRGWRAQNALLVQQVDGERRPSLGHEYMLYQALIGAWPEAIDPGFVERMCAYAVKAAREGKEETSWTNPNEPYEAGLQQFLRDLLDETTSPGFLASFREFVERTALIGALNGLSQLALKGLLPGVPDFYQGTEFWNLSLVDPDNRRPVDFARREQALAAEVPGWPELAAGWRDGRIKLALTRALLRLRHECAEIFRNGTYQPLPVTGRHAGHVIAFSRSFKRQRLIVAVGRHFAPLTDGGRRWPDAFEAAIPLGATANYADVIDPYSNFRTSELNLAHQFRHLPVSVLRRT